MKIFGVFGFFAYLVFFVYLMFFGIVGVFWRSWCFFGIVGVFWRIWCIFWRIWCFLAYLVFFWRIWCFALRTCFLFGVLGVWFGVFGILSSLKMCRFLLINFAESSLYCVFCGKRYTGWKKVHHRRWCGGGLISGMPMTWIIKWRWKPDHNI